MVTGGGSSLSVVTNCCVRVPGRGGGDSRAVALLRRRCLMVFWLWSVLGLAILSLQDWIFPPQEYTICSPTRNIYTVEDNSRVECISVSGTRIVATGEQCMFSACLALAVS